LHVVLSYTLSAAGNDKVVLINLIKRHFGFNGMLTSYCKLLILLNNVFYAVYAV